MSDAPEQAAPIAVGQTVHWNEGSVRGRTMSIRLCAGIVRDINLSSQVATIKTPGGKSKTIPLARIHEAGGPDVIARWLHAARQQGGTDEE